ncbi:MAG: HlyC/CorC family transporter [Rhodospirillaceae bacterium]|nr:HlyC/CorC family transporter [Rhodospirillaceae bacterium]MBT4590301.1 HlyC/CorC family transporter [Rhodospirillaceae bacterium]MBT5938562.1 HlyC/CorC family transporter [Rhodospirillaceae bacterium]MBT7266969.1 HlyC/CorC family transporter [Rhodospirillaceae bacterium]
MNEDSSSRMPRQNGAETETGFWKSLLGWGQRLVQPRNGEDSVREAIEELIEESGDDATLLEAEEHNLLSNILSLRDRTVSDVMVPRADICALDVNASVSDLIALINSEAHSRVPIYQETLDDAIGMIHIKDVMAAHSILEPQTADDNGKNGGDLHLRNIMRDVLFVAPSMQALELLLEMRVKRTHMALVVDEFGGVDGLLTIEDIVEEIVGEIEDEHDQDEEPQLSLKPDGSIEADARATIEAFEERIGEVVTQEEREEFETLGGLVFSLAGRVPIRGELVNHSCGMEIEIIDADPRRIKKIRIRGLKTNPASGPASGGDEISGDSPGDSAGQNSADVPTAN